MYNFRNVLVVYVYSSPWPLALSIFLEASLQVTSLAHVHLLWRAHDVEWTWSGIHQAPWIECAPHTCSALSSSALPQEQTLQMFHDYDSEGGVDSDAELRLERLPSGMLSGEEDVEIEEYEADDFGQEAFQLTSFTDDFDDADEDETKQLL